MMATQTAKIEIKEEDKIKITHIRKASIWQYDKS